MSDNNNEKSQNIKMTLSFVFGIIFAFVLLYPLYLLYQTYSYNQFVKNNTCVEAVITKLYYTDDDQVVEINQNQIEDFKDNDYIYGANYEYQVNRKTYSGSVSDVSDTELIINPLVYYSEIKPEENFFFVGQKSLLFPIVLSATVLVFDLMLFGVGMSISSSKKRAKKFEKKYNNYVSKINQSNDNSFRQYDENTNLYGIYNEVSSGSYSAGSVNDRYYNRFNNNSATANNNNSQENKIDENITETTPTNSDRIGFYGVGDGNVEEYF